MPLGQPPSRRPGYKYDRTDLLLLGGGALLVVFGLILALNAWLDPAARPDVARRFSALKPDATAGDSAAVRLRTAAALDSAGRTAAGVSEPVPGAPVMASADSAPPPDSAARARLAGAQTASAAVAVAVPAPSSGGSASKAATAATGLRTAPPTSAPSAASSPPPPTAASGAFALQVGAFGQRANADKLATAIDQLGFHAEVVNPPAGTSSLHRVRVTGFSTRELAEAARDSIGRTLGERATVTGGGRP